MVHKYMVLTFTKWLTQDKINRFKRRVCEINELKSDHMQTSLVTTIN